MMMAHPQYARYVHLLVYNVHLHWLQLVHHAILCTYDHYPLPQVVVAVVSMGTTTVGL